MANINDKLTKDITKIIYHLTNDELNTIDISNLPLLSTLIETEKDKRYCPLVNTYWMNTRNSQINIYKLISFHEFNNTYYAESYIIGENVQLVKNYCVITASEIKRDFNEITENKFDEIKSNFYTLIDETKKMKARYVDSILNTIKKI